MKPDSLTWDRDNDTGGDNDNDDNTTEEHNEAVTLCKLVWIFIMIINIKQNRL